ncbi:MAG: protein TolQ [Methyloprofundus sp.]|nr:protein TolQ [Methyloprofundus sp.]
MTNDLSILYLITQASFVVQLVMFILLMASIVSWTFIFAKYKELKNEVQIADDFEAEFWSGGDLSELYKNITSDESEAEGLEKIFVAGYKEFSRSHALQGMSAKDKVDSARQVMQIELTRELERLDESLPFLATVGSTSPYVGLFGTVWGIMNSFRSLSSAKQATLAQVAPGIAEALVATAIGLFAAIPAVVAYNSFSTRIDRLAGRYELFVDEFVVLLHRQAYS